MPLSKPIVAGQSTVNFAALCPCCDFLGDGHGGLTRKPVSRGQGTNVRSLRKFRSRCPFCARDARGGPSVCIGRVALPPAPARFSCNPDRGHRMSSHAKAVGKRGGRVCPDPGAYLPSVPVRQRRVQRSGGVALPGAAERASGPRPAAAGRPPAMPPEAARGAMENASPEGFRRGAKFRRWRRRRAAGVARCQVVFLPLIPAQIRLFVRYSRTDRMVRNSTPTKPACWRAIILGSAAHIRNAATSWDMWCTVLE